MLHARNRLNFVGFRATFNHCGRCAINDSHAVSEDEQDIFRGHCKFCVAQAWHIRVDAQGKRPIRGGRQDYSQVCKVNSSGLRKNNFAKFSQVKCCNGAKDLSLRDLVRSHYERVLRFVDFRHECQANGHSFLANSMDRGRSFVCRLYVLKRRRVRGFHLKHGRVFLLFRSRVQRLRHDFDHSFRLRAVISVGINCRSVYYTLLRGNRACRKLITFFQCSLSFRQGVLYGCEFCHRCYGGSGPGGGLSRSNLF